MIRLLTLLFCLALTGFHAQENSVKYRFVFKASVAQHPTNSFNYNGSDWSNVKTPNYRIDAAYGFHKLMEGLLYVGGQKDDFFIDQNTTTTLFLPSFGLGLNFHLMPLISPKKSLPLDVYAYTRIGGLDVKLNSNPYYSGFYPEYSIGLGGAVYFLKGLGVSGEFGLGKFYFRNDFPAFPNQENLGKDKYKIRIGLVYKITSPVDDELDF